jgi:hypothetical protein
MNPPSQALSLLNRTETQFSCSSVKYDRMA